MCSKNSVIDIDDKIDKIKCILSTSEIDSNTFCTIEEQLNMISKIVHANMDQ